ncbi:MAG TPA: tetratricopeptide repeat protein [Burkholderiales bacterium]|nr:tetratricopeptide repeat protein [Burkholderiales bacterium]
MLADQYDLPVSTSSAAARDAYVEGCELALTIYPGALEAFDRALDADPRLAMAHAGKAQVLMREGKVAQARAAMTAANDRAAGVSAREGGHIRFFDLAFSGRTDAAIDALYAHLAEWPRDALMVAVAANPNGLLGVCGRVGQKQQCAQLLDRLAPHYGDDYWFLSYHAIALGEDGRIAEARRKIERSVGLNRKNAHCAHGVAHVCYESGDADGGRDFLSSWLAEYPREGSFHGHLSWHLALIELGAGNWTAAQQLYRDAVAPDRHPGGPQQKTWDGVAFLWRSELAGHPRNDAAWRTLYDYAASALPRPGAGLADLHVMLAHAVLRDAAALDARTRQIDELAREGRYPSGSYVPELARGFVAFERGDYSAAIAALAPLARQSERIGGSRAQHDLIELTLLKAYLNAERLDEARQLLAMRRPGAAGAPVSGAAALS